MLDILISGVYFIKKRSEPIPKEECAQFLVYGDLATKAIDQLSRYDIVAQAFR